MWWKRKEEPQFVAGKDYCSKCGTVWRFPNPPTTLIYREDKGEEWLDEYCPKCTHITKKEVLC